MKLLKLGMAAVAALAFDSAYAFHDGGVAECDGCHVMHNASNGAAATTKAGSKYAPRTNQTNSYLLQGSDQSSTCLICHGQPYSATSAYHIAALDGSGAENASPTGLNYTPGGDFSWLRVTKTYAPWPGASVTSYGERKGHNIVAYDFGLGPDSTLSIAPGGTFAGGTGKAAFACTNCHDPHGQIRLTTGGIVGPSKVGTAISPIAMSGSYGDAPTASYAVGIYRLLAGKGYAPLSNPGFPFVSDPPIAVAPSAYNAPESGTSEVRVAYGTGMSEWCQNCHTNIHLDGYVTGAPGLRHPAGSNAKFRQVQADVYNAYVSSGDLTGTNKYTSLVPFESGSADVAALKLAASSGAVPAPTPALLVAATTSNVMCVSCHRTHASGFDSMTRWSMQNTFVTEAGALVLDAGKNLAQTQAAYYGRTIGSGFGDFQRVMCNKCHAKD